MSNFTKNIHQDDEDEQYSLSQKGTRTAGSSNEVVERSYERDRQDQLVNRLCVTALIILLIVSISIFTYRYFELAENLKENKFNKGEIQANMQSGELSQHEHEQNLAEKEKPLNLDGTSLKVTQSGKEIENGINNHKQTEHINEQHRVEEPSQINENSMEYKQSESIQKEESEILDQGSISPSEIDDDSENSHNEEQETETEVGLESELNNVGSIEEAQLLHEKNAYLEAEMKLQELNNIKSELSLHSNVKKHYKELFADEEEEEEKPQTTENNELPVEKNEEIKSKSATEEPESQMQDTESEQNKEPLEDEETENEEDEEQSEDQEEAQKTETAEKAISAKHITDKDLFDPIVRVKSQIEKNLNNNFDDLFYIKAGTNITEEQYKLAIERMHLWKFFNPLTKKLEILDEKDVNYEGLDLSTPESTKALLEKMERMKLEEKLEYEKKYQVSQYGEIPFCIIIPSYKNQDKYLRNLNSILQQDYDNYHIVYIDDASKDGTAEKVKSYIDKYKVPESRLLFIENKVNKKALPNIDYAARRLCNSGEIMTIIDGDDYLIGTQVFKIINARYQKESLLVLYTNHLRVHEPIYLKVGTCIDYPEKVKKSRSFRRFSIFPASHLRTFFVDLYWRISIRDLKDYQGGYFTAANDFAIMMPILEMAGERYQYFSELTYVYDAGTGNNNFQTKADKQAKNFKITKRRHKYPKIEHELEFEKNLRAKGLMKPLSENRSTANRLRRNVRKI